MKSLSVEDQQKLNELYSLLLQKQKTYIGYPNSQLLNNESLSRFLDLTINNVGDPFRGNNGMNTFALETEVIEFMSSLMHLETENMWGYVTNGGTEGNTYGLYLAREAHPHGIVYFSGDAHYSIPKAVKLLGMRSSVIQSQPNGEMDYDHFEQTVKTLKHYPVIVNANIGTTMKGAIDNVPKILSILSKLKISNYYIHCDAALFGAMLPFMADAPSFDFRLPVNSVAVSGHKFLGSPIPCGIVLARKALVNGVKGTVEYIGSLDSTLSGSRDGFSVLVLWQTIKRYGREGIKDLVHRCMRTTEYALEKLRDADWPSWANPYSNIIVIRRPSDALIQKWQLATEGNISHLIIMPGVSEEMVNAFVADLVLQRVENRRVG